MRKINPEIHKRLLEMKKVMSYERMARVLDVSLSSVRRWVEGGGMSIAYEALIRMRLGRKK